MSDNTYLRHTYVCRNAVGKGTGGDPIQCAGGGRWGDEVLDRCARCGGKLTELVPVIVTELGIPDV